MRKRTTSQRRNYKVLTTADAKKIASNFIHDAIDYNFGLPEIDDRYDVWKVPIKNASNVTIGIIIVDAYQGEVNVKRSTSLELMIRRIGSEDNNSKELTRKEKSTYAISKLQNTLIHGDSLDELDKLEDESVDLVFTSPPYFNARVEYSEYSDYSEYIDFLREIIKKCFRVLGEGRFFVINTSPVLIPRASRSESSKRIAVPFDLHAVLVDEGFEFVDDIIWQKPEGAGWATGRGRRFFADRNPLQYKPVPVTEYVLVYRKPSKKLIDWYIRNHPDRKIIEESKVEDGYEKTNVWYISPARDKRHRAIFPQSLAEKVIEYYSFKNDVVLDPFAGLGTTGKAASKLGRRYYLIEKDKFYYDESVKDLNKINFLF